MSSQEKNEIEGLEGDVLMKTLIDDLNEIMRDIDLGYRRVNYNNMVVNHMLKMVYSLLGVIKEHLKFEDLGVVEKKEVSPFGISKEDLYGK